MTNESSTDNGSRKERKPTALSRLLDRRLAAYSLAAGTAGVGMAALAQDVPHRTILYVPTDIQVSNPDRSSILFPFDFNRDGIIDFNLSAAGSGGYSGSSNAFYAGGVGWSQQPAGAGAVNRALSKGMEIGPLENFVSRGKLLSSMWSLRRGQTHQTCKGLYTSGKPYLGVKFQINGETHYGWMRISLSCEGHGQVAGVVSGYAYNTVANVPIQAGQIRSGEVGVEHMAVPGSLGELSLGAAGRK